MASLKQRRNLRLMAHLTGTVAPEVASLDAKTADVLWGQRWSLWMDQQRALAKAQLF